MIGANKGFALAIRRLEGRKDADVSTSEKARRWESTGYGCILKLLRGEWSWGNYVRGMYGFSFEERQAMLAARQHIGLHAHTLGLHVNNQRTLAAAVEYFERHPIGGEQTGVSEGTHRASPEPDTPDVLRDPRYYLPRGLFSTIDSPSLETCSGSEPVGWDDNGFVAVDTDEPDLW